MANPATNMFYVSGSKENIEFVLSKISEYFSNIFIIHQDNDYTELEFDSDWTFPEVEMTEIYENLPDKDNIWIRCLSYEFGTFYHSFWICDEDGWKEV